MGYWVGVRDVSPATFVGEIRDMPLLQHSRAFACIAGWTCFPPVGGAIDDPFMLAAALLLDGAKDVERAKAACRSLFRLTLWPLEESATYRDSRTDAERADIVIRRMEIWRTELSAPRKERRSRPQRNKQESMQS
jgi:hypothetical protein